MQTDIKRILAYSTCSQLGFMMLALGVGGWVAGLLHLITHAFFKALLFLCSGSVIHGCHHEQDIRKMGGLWRVMPITAFTMLVGVLAISGTPLFSGWYSKDQIIGGRHRVTASTIRNTFLLLLLPLAATADDRVLHVPPLVPDVRRASRAMPTFTNTPTNRRW